MNILKHFIFLPYLLFEEIINIIKSSEIGFCVAGIFDLKQKLK